MYGTVNSNSNFRFVYKHTIQQNIYTHLSHNKMTSSLFKRLYRVNLFIKKFLHSTAHLFSAFHIYVGYQSGFSLINSVEYTKIIISLFCASRWNGNLWWNPSIASYCIVGHTFNLLLLLCNYSYQLSVGEDIFVRMEF